MSSNCDLPVYSTCKLSWKKELTQWCISVQCCDWNGTWGQLATVTLLLLGIAWLGCTSWEKRGVSQRCDGGIMEFLTGQRRTIDLSVGSLCPPLICHNIHHSLAVHQPRVSRKSWELWITLLSVCLLPSFTSSIPLSSNVQYKRCPPMLSCITQNSKWWSKEMR